MCIRDSHYSLRATHHHGGLTRTYVTSIALSSHPLVELPAIHHLKKSKVTTAKIGTRTTTEYAM